MEDMISRQALCEYALNQKDKSITPNDIMRFPSAQPDSKETSSTHKALDTISRQDVIDAMEKVQWAKVRLMELPSAQPEKRTEERTETHACDYINRKDAIDAHYEYCNKHPDAGFPVWSLKILEELPSVQPEIIRCKDCKQHGTKGYRLNCAVFCCTMPDDGFCSCGERREDG